MSNNQRAVFPDWVITTFIVMAVCGGLLGKLAPENAGKSVPWEGTAACCVIFAVAAAVAVCALPLAAGHVWKEQSEYLGRWGDCEFRVYLPRSFAGWVGYYFATGLAGICCLMLGLALIAVFSMRFATRPCR